jgi:hypothetical protein
MNTNTIPPFSIPLPLRRSMRKKPGVGLFIGLSAIVMIVLSGSILGAYFLLRPSPSRFVGHAFFLSSAQWNDSGSQGDNDRLKIELHNMPDPDPDKIYYAWLLSDKDQGSKVALPLGILPFDRGNVDFLYQNKQGNNLLATTSSLLITQEDRQSTPTQPSSQKSYYAELPQPIALSSLRALLYQEPYLSQLGIQDDLNIRFLRNIGKLQEWIFSAKDATELWGNQDAHFIHRQLVNVLEYLDGTNGVQVDLPPGTPLPPGAASPIPLVAGPSSQGSTSYIELIHKHLTDLMAAPGGTLRMHTLALESDKALIGSVQNELLQVRQLAKALVFMQPDAQLLSPAAQTMLSKMVLLAHLAFVGQLDPSTNLPQPGVAQIFYKIQGLAAYDINPY